MGIKLSITAKINHSCLVCKHVPKSERPRHHDRNDDGYPMHIIRTESDDWRGGSIHHCFCGKRYCEPRKCNCGYCSGVCGPTTCACPACYREETWHVNKKPAETDWSLCREMS
jgi:hypothetical protein